MSTRLFPNPRTSDIYGRDRILSFRQSEVSVMTLRSDGRNDVFSVSPGDG